MPTSAKERRPRLGGTGLWVTLLVILVTSGVFGFVVYGTRFSARGLPTKWLKTLEGADTTEAQKMVYTSRGDVVFAVREWDQHSERRVIAIDDVVLYAGRGTGYAAQIDFRTQEVLAGESLGSVAFTPRILNDARDELRSAAEPFSPYKIDGENSMSYQDGDEMRRISRSETGFIFSRLRRSDDGIWKKASEVMIALTDEFNPPSVGDLQPPTPNAADPKKVLTWAMRSGMLFAEIETDRGMNMVSENPDFYATQLKFELGRSLVMLLPRYDAPPIQWPVTVPLKVTKIPGMLYDRDTKDSTLKLTFAKPSAFTPIGFKLILPGDQAVYRLEAIRRFFLAQDRLNLLRSPGHPAREAGATVASRTVEDLQAAAQDLEHAVAIQRVWGSPFADAGEIYWQLYLVYGELGEPEKARIVLREGAKNGAGNGPKSMEINQAMEREGLR